MKLSKKGSISLSINAIVVLILAMAMLGVGLLIMNIFTEQGVGTLEESFSSVDQRVRDELESSSERIAMARSSLNLEKGSKELIPFVVNNDFEDSVGRGKFDLGNGDTLEESHIFCYQSLDADETPEDVMDYFKFRTATPIYLDAGSNKVQNLEVEVKRSAPASDYNCEIVLCNPEIDDSVEVDISSEPHFVTETQVCDNVYDVLEFNIVVK